MSSGVPLPSGLLISASQQTLCSDTLQASFNQQPQQCCALSSPSAPGEGRRKDRGELSSPGAPIGVGLCSEPSALPCRTRGLCCPFSPDQPGHFARRGEGSTLCCLKDKSPGVAAARCAALTASLLLIHFARFLLASFLLGSDQAGTAVNRAIASC